ncbi:hypothetical protein ZIOFF_072416 [Zingiber officinale]|uniref:CCHC-type domain-containing protein n=1 Tax=Zingiber officinale TaxID=94328 RepID=A0A8J5C6L2_ZINOF|nr:hypothetical protein ZIOFF_072416 [Zingiber officinale]
MGTLTTMKFDGSCTMHEHVIEMTNIAARIKSLGMEVDENFLVQFILNSLPSEYGPFQMNYNTMKDKWNVHELHSMLVQEETRLNNQGNHSIHYVNHQGAGKKIEKRHGKGKGQLKICESSTKIQKKESNKNKCHFCGKFGHFQKDCQKRKAWFEKKGKLIAYVCLESNLTEVPHNTWWLDSGGTTHVSNTMQGFLTIQTISPNEKFILMGNRVKVPVEAVGTYRLILDTGHHLDLYETLYVPSISRNLVSVSKLDVAGYYFKFGNGCFSLYKHTYMIGSESTEEFTAMEFRLTLRDDGMRAAFQLLHMVLEILVKGEMAKTNESILLEEEAIEENVEQGLRSHPLFFSIALGLLAEVINSRMSLQLASLENGITEQYLQLLWKSRGLSLILYLNSLPPLHYEPIVVFLPSQDLLPWFVSLCIEGSGSRVGELVHRLFTTVRDSLGLTYDVSFE